MRMPNNEYIIWGFTLPFLSRSPHHLEMNLSKLPLLLLRLSCCFASPSKFRSYLDCQCGERKVVEEGGQGGTASEAGRAEFPWAARLEIRIGETNFQCGGTLLTDRHVLTAAHCVKPGNQSLYVTVILGRGGQQHQISYLSIWWIVWEILVYCRGVQGIRVGPDGDSGGRVQVSPPSSLPGEQLALRLRHPHPAAAPQFPQQSQHQVTAWWSRENVYDDEHFYFKARLPAQCRLCWLSWPDWGPQSRVGARSEWREVHRLPADLQ